MVAGGVVVVVESMSLNHQLMLSGNKIKTKDFELFRK
jgi:hypothetical protein